MTSSAAATQQQTIDINTLSIEDLSNLKQQLDDEMAFLNGSVVELRAVSSKFGRCQVTLDSINVEEKEKPALIPLSESLYVKAKVVNPDRYLVEIGTGYFIKMDRKQALEYFKRKYHFLEAQIAAITRTVVPEKQQLRQMVLVALQKKIQMATAAGSASK